MSETKTVWHPYPKEMPNMAGGEKYIVTLYSAVVFYW